MQTLIDLESVIRTSLLEEFFFEQFRRRFREFERFEQFYARHPPAYLTGYTLNDPILFAPGCMFLLFSLSPPTNFLFQFVSPLHQPTKLLSVH